MTADRRKKAKAGARSRATVDRFEDTLAVLIMEGREVTRPREALPPEAREGDVLDLDTNTVDRAATERLREEVRQARERTRSKTPPPGDFDL